MQLIIPIHRSANKAEAGRNSFIVAAGAVPASELNYFERAALARHPPIHINAQGCNKRQRRATTHTHTHTHDTLASPF